MRIHLLLLLVECVVQAVSSYNKASSFLCWRQLSYMKPVWIFRSHFTGWIHLCPLGTAALSRIVNRNTANIQGRASVAVVGEKVYILGFVTMAILLLRSPGHEIWRPKALCAEEFVSAAAVTIKRRGGSSDIPIVQTVLSWYGWICDVSAQDEQQQ